jgi:hypothetical protein
VQFLLFCLVASGSEYPCFLKSRIDFNHRRRFSFLHLFFGFWWPRGCSPSPIFCCRHNFLRCCCPARGPVLCSSPCFRVRSSPQFLLPAPGSAHISHLVRSLCKEFFFGTRSIFVHFIFWCRWTMSFAAWAHCEFFSFSTLSAGSILTPSSSFYCVSDLILRRLGHSRSALVQEQRPRSSPLLRFSALATGSPRLQAHKQTLR